VGQGARNIRGTEAPEWYASNATIIFPYVKRAMSSDAIAEAFRPVFEKLLTVLPPSEDTEGSPDFATQFHGWITDFVGEALGSGVRVHAALIVLQSLVKQYPGRIEPVLPNFIRLFARLSKEHLGDPAHGRRRSHQSPPYCSA
jgi:hypothetical protein